MACPSVARRSPAITTPSAKRSATTVVPWRNRSAAGGPGERRERPIGAGAGTATCSRRMSPAKSGPGSSSSGRTAGTPRLLAALLHVVAHELLGVVLEDLVDLVEQVVELGLQLLARRGRSRAPPRRPRRSAQARVFFFCSRSAIPISLAAQPVQQLGRARTLVQQFFDMFGRALQWIHHRDAA